MDQTLVASIRKSMEDKSAAELRQAYESQDHTTWSPEAFEAMRQLLEQPRISIPVVCSLCKSPMQSLDQVSFRVGGVTGAWHFFLGASADYSEGLLPLDVYRCSRCKRVEFFDLDDRLTKADQT